jgi:Protein NO VEIN, C-terminal
VADQAKSGTDWTAGELDAIVADYFVMLGDELAGRPYVKSQHNALLVAQTGRSRGSVEFKYQNVSAVLERMGLPWIFGFKPARNYQNALFDAIDRCPLKGSILSYVPPRPSMPLLLEEKSEVFVPVPALEANVVLPEKFERLIRKFDPVERDFRNRALGKAGEEFVLDLERKALSRQDRTDLAGKVRWVSQEDGDGAGFDVLSYDASGKERLIEVKTTNGSAKTPFFLTRNERDVSNERADAWHLYRVHLFAQAPQIFTVRPPLENALYLNPESWRASFR